MKTCMLTIFVGCLFLPSTGFGQTRSPIREVWGEWDVSYWENVEQAKKYSPKVKQSVISDIEESMGLELISRETINYDRKEHHREGWMDLAPMTVYKCRRQERLHFGFDDSPPEETDDQVEEIDWSQYDAEIQALIQAAGRAKTRGEAEALMRRAQELGREMEDHAASYGSRQTGRPRTGGTPPVGGRGTGSSGGGKGSAGQGTGSAGGGSGAQGGVGGEGSRGEDDVGDFGSWNAPDYGDGDGVVDIGSWNLPDFDPPIAVGHTSTESLLDTLKYLYDFTGYIEEHEAVLKPMQGVQAMALLETIAESIIKIKEFEKNINRIYDKAFYDSALREFEREVKGIQDEVFAYVEGWKKYARENPGDPGRVSIPDQRPPWERFPHLQDHKLTKTLQKMMPDGEVVTVTVCDDYRNCPSCLRKIHTATSTGD